ncbi:hypothetical protein cypCar_00020561 [Cyprinus carpio]|nr:hypothetical protein cypCar_00020561 [Cyprinus carpio]
MKQNTRAGRQIVREGMFDDLRSAKKIRKTRKYDIITTPAKRVEMAPLNEENYEDDDSTLFDVKYREILTESLRE